MADYDTWRIVNTSPSPAALAQFASVCTIANGYLGLKGHVAEDRDGECAVTLLAGVFDELDMFGQLRLAAEPRPYLDPRYFDSAGRSPAVANLPSPLFVQVFVDEREVSLTRGGVANFEQVFDLTCGLYSYRFDYTDGLGRTTRLTMERFAALRDAHRVYMRYTLTPLNHERTPLRLHSGIDGRVRSNVTGERASRVTELWADPPQRCRLVAQTRARQHEVRLGVQHTLSGAPPAEDPRGVAEHDRVYTRYAFVARRDTPLVLERYIALTCTEDLRHRAVAVLDDELDAAAETGFDEALAGQRDAWAELWARTDVQLDGDPPAQLGLRFCIHQVLAAAPRFTDRLSVPVKLLSGEHYQGSVFYDTDLYIVPFYALTVPEYARTCLDFRHEGLRAAREIARGLGRRGAKFPWQAGPAGEECLGKWWHFTHRNIHVNAAVAYALQQYVRATGDEHYLFTRGIDVLVETARFYASRTKHDAAGDRYDLLDVAGPDEGHCESDNNFYTNYLAAWNLRWAADVLADLAESDPAAHAVAVRRLALGRDEPAQWRRVADGLPLLQDGDTGVYEQCAGFFSLPPRPPDLLDERVAWLVTVAPYQALQQPDVVLALALFGDEFTPEVRRANWEFYRDRSLDFSSISHAANALVAADVGDAPAAYRNFILTTGRDLDASLTGRHDTYAGLHGTACAGAWLAAVCGFGGVRLTADGLRIDPRLPEDWSALRFTLACYGVSVQVTIDRAQVTLTIGRERRAEFGVTIGGHALTVRSGETHTVAHPQT